MFNWLHWFQKRNINWIAIDVGKEQVSDADPKVIQQINFTGHLDRAGNTTIFFIYEEATGTTWICGTTVQK